MSSLSNLSAPANTRSRAVLAERNLLDSPVNQPKGKGSIVTHWYNALDELSQYGAVVRRGVRHTYAGSVVDSFLIMIPGTDTRADSTFRIALVFTLEVHESQVS